MREEVGSQDGSKVIVTWNEVPGVVQIGVQLPESEVANLWNDDAFWRDFVRELDRGAPARHTFQRMAREWFGYKGAYTQLDRDASLKLLQCLNDVTSQVFGKKP